MNRQEENQLTKFLQQAKASYDQKYAPSADVIEKSRARVMAYVSAHGGKPAKTLGFVDRLRFYNRFLPSLIPPQLAYGVMAIIVFMGIGLTATAAWRSFPGQSLYSTKLAIENTGARFVSNPAERAKVQMEIAGNRLEEVRQGTDSPEQEVRVLKHFSQSVKEAQATLKQAADPLQVEAAQQELNKKAQEYQEKLLQTKLANKVNREVGVAAYEEAEQALKDVTDDVNGLSKPPLTPP